MSDNTPKETISRVVMSKKIARKYVKDVSDAGYTITAYSSSSKRIQEFLEEVRSKFSDKISSVREGFDHITVLTMDEDAMNEISEIASLKGLQTTEQ